jgi:outer membrane protein
MKRLFLYIMLLAATWQVQAQEANTFPEVMPMATTQTPVLRFGYFSYKTTLETMPGYAIARRNLDDLRIKYENEMKRVEEEFNKKYEDFLEGQKNFAPSILQKRQAELQELMEKNMAFKQEAKRLLKQAEEEAYQPLREQLIQATLVVGKSKGLAFILNTDDNAVPYINPSLGEDVSAAIVAALH